jgi:hypothetical protein
MNRQHLETITKARQCAELLVGDIGEAQKRACRDNPALEILLRELIGDAVTVKDRLAEIEACFS